MVHYDHSRALLKDTLQECDPCALLSPGAHRWGFLFQELMQQRGNKITHSILLMLLIIYV